MSQSTTLAQSRMRLSKLLVAFSCTRCMKIMQHFSSLWAPCETSVSTVDIFNLGHFSPSAENLQSSQAADSSVLRSLQPTEFQLNGVLQDPVQVHHGESSGVGLNCYKKYTLAVSSDLVIASFQRETRSKLLKIRDLQSVPVSLPSECWM